MMVESMAPSVKINNDKVDATSREILNNTRNIEMMETIDADKDINASVSGLDAVPS